MPTARLQWGFTANLLQILVGAVAEGAVPAVLAAAEVNGSILLGGVGLGGKVASLVRTVAERLGGTLAAGAPVVGLACFDLDRDG